MAALSGVPWASSASSMEAMSSSAQAIAAFRAIFAVAMFWEEPRARNSNLLPVNANGLVRLRSDRSRGMFGNTETPIWSGSEQPPAASFP